MRKIKITLIVLALGILGLKAQSDSIISITIEEAQKIALENNLEKKNADLDVIAAQKKVWETTAIGLPQISGSYSFQYIPGEIPNISFLDSTSFPGLPDEAYTPTPLAVKNSATYNLTVSQLIFSGEYIVGLQASKTYKLISELNAQKKEIDLKANVISGYISILLLDNNLASLDTSITNLEQLVFENKKMYENGLIEETDIDQLQLTLNNMISTRKSLERNLKISQDLFKITLNIDQNVHINLSDDLLNISNTYAQPDIDLAAFNLDNNLEYQMVENQVEISQLQLKREQSMYLPNLSAFYQYSDKTNAPAFDFTINHIIGINASISLFTSGQRNAKVQQAKIELEKSKNNIDFISKNIELQSNQAKFNFFNAIDKYENEKLNVKLSKKILSNTQLKYKEGMASSFELTDANNQYLESNNNLTQALFELINAKIEYQKIINKL